MNIQITDIKVPERSVSNIIAILESNNLPTRIPRSELGSCSYNCWGFVAYYCQWETRVFWMDNPQIKMHLKEHTKSIGKKDAKAGDIAVFYQGDYLSHTAILLPGGNMVCHKPGRNELCIDTIEAASKSYGNVTYARVIEESEKTI